jgi:hypothetical protein
MAHPEALRAHSGAAPSGAAQEDGNAEAQEQRRRADALDERARRIVDGWSGDLAQEREAAAGYPAGPVSAVVSCPDCSAPATAAFEPRALRVSFACGRNPGHGFFRLGNDDQEPIAVWRSEGREYVALGLVAPVLAAGDDAWDRVYGTRADDYRATVRALATFDAENPQPMQLTPNIRCSDCGSRLSIHPPIDLGRGEKEEASYSCGTRHEDGRYRRHRKKAVDVAIDQQLLQLLRRHTSWATAAELEPDPAAVADYARYLDARIATYDAHAGAASADHALAREKSELDKARRLVTTMQERGGLAAAGLAAYRADRMYIGPQVVFTDLGRALLTTRVDVSTARVAVFTAFDEGTPLYRSLRSREIHEELATLQAHQQELTEELAKLTAQEQGPAAPPGSGRHAGD